MRVVLDPSIGALACCLLLAAGLAGCSPEVGSKTAKDAEDAAMSETVAEVAREPVVTLISGADVLSVVVPAGTDPEAYRAMGREICAGKQFCQAHFWTDASKAATAFPMTEQEAADRVFSYSLNRDTGFDRALWNCEVAPRSNTDECLG